MPSRARGTGNESREDGGSKGVGLAIAGIVVAFFTTLPLVFIVILYLFVTVYAIVRAIGPGAGENPVAILVGFALVTSALALLLAMSVQLVGRSLTPRRRRSKG